MVGTRGVPARYGGFETAIEEIGERLASRGHDVTVYCRTSRAETPREHRGMRLVALPALRSKSLETLTNTVISAGHALWNEPQDVAFVFNAANAPFIPLLRRRGTRIVTHVDGLEWRRAKWGRRGRSYYRMAESLAVRWSDALIADANGIARYYEDEFRASTEVIAYGAPILRQLGTDHLHELGACARQFHLVVARLEPENHVDLIVRGYRSSSARFPLLVVGSAPYAAAHSQQIRRLAETDPRIRLVGAVWDQALLDQLYGHAVLYLHGHSVGGTNPSLLRAMGAGAATAAFNVVFNAEVLGAQRRLFTDEATVADLVERAERDPVGTQSYGRALQARASARYRWDDVADEYEGLARRVASGASRRGEVSGHRTRPSAWTGASLAGPAVVRERVATTAACPDEPGLSE